MKTVQSSFPPVSLVIFYYILDIVKIHDTDIGFCYLLRRTIDSFWSTQFNYWLINLNLAMLHFMSC